MKKNKNKKQIFHSITDFEKHYFPKSFEENITKRQTDARSLGINLAKESLENMRKQLIK